MHWSGICLGSILFSGVLTRITYRWMNWMMPQTFQSLESNVKRSWFPFHSTKGSVSGQPIQCCPFLWATPSKQARSWSTPCPCPPAFTKSFYVACVIRHHRTVSIHIPIHPIHKTYPNHPIHSAWAYDVHQVYVPQNNFVWAASRYDTEVPKSKLADRRTSMRSCLARASS